ncbi:MAG: NUDIX hydrolase [Armatimonadota bacterium]
MSDSAGIPEEKAHIPKHIVAVSGLITDPSSGDVLLIRSPRRGWEFPGGQVEEGKSLTEALIREVSEETGLVVSVGPLIGVYSNVHSHIVMFGFLCEWMGIGKPTPSLESVEVEWMPREEARTRVVRPPLRDRLRDMLDFSGQIIYRSYEYSALREAGTDYRVREERQIGTT